MTLTNYDIIYLMSNTFGTYVIFKFMSVFFDRRDTDRRRELASYAIYFAIISLIYITFNNPILNLISNLVMFFLITLNYPSKLKRRIVAVIYIYAILISVEAATIIIFGVLNINDAVYGVDMELILSQVMSKILSYVVVLVIANFRMLRAKYDISHLHWAAVFIIPISTLYFTAVLILQRHQGDDLLIFISIAFLFLINIFVFYLYDTLLKTYEEKIEKNILKQQNDAYLKQFEIIEQSRQNISILRHDMKLHLSTLRSLIKKGDDENTLGYLNEIFNSINSADEYARSGNIGIDSIINYKCQSAVAKGIAVDVEIAVPKDLDIQPFDLVTIIGNLFDNAIQAVSKLDENKKIDLKISFDRNILYIAMTNPYAGELVYEGGCILSTHEDRENHGLGLESVRNSVGKYNGEMKIDHQNSMFQADLMLYNPKNC